MTSRSSRNELLFGAEGQAAIARSRIALIGLGGLGSHVAQQLAYLGVNAYALVDRDGVTESSLNRLIGSAPGDAPANAPKVDVARRMILHIQPGASVRTYPHLVGDEQAEEAFSEADIVFGCVDNERARLTITELAMSREIAYLDLASDIDPSVPTYGGRTFFALPGVRCMSCTGVLDQRDLALGSLSSDQLAAYDKIYGIARDALEGGPAVVSVNGVVASLAVTEFVVWVTGLREPISHLVYYGNSQTIRKRIDRLAPTCPYCRPNSSPPSTGAVGRLE